MSQLSLPATAPHPGRIPRPEPRLASFVLALAAVLIVIGVIMAFSTSASLDQPFWPHSALRAPALRQGVFAAAAIAAMWLASVVGFRPLRWRQRADGAARPWWQQPAALLMAFTLVCLVAALIPGLAAERNGARRWLQFGPPGYGLGFQPSELAKISVVALLAAWLPAMGPRLREFWGGILKPGMVLAAVVSLVGVEDLGTAALLVAVGGLLILAAGARWWHALLLALPGMGAFAAMVLTRDYRWARLVSFWHIWDDPLGAGYHAIQSLIAIASGGWRGVGLGAGLQKFGYLPEARNDFVFAVICEEMGLIGALAVIGLFACLCLAGWRIMLQSHDAQGKLLALGVTMMFGFQATMNMAVVTVMVPTKGISLPLISAGGSGVILYGAAVGLLAATGRAQRPVDARCP